MNTTKTRQQVAEEYGISRKTFYRWMKREKIALSNGLIYPKDMKVIYERLGTPK